MPYRYNCEVTAITRTISGVTHRLVRRLDGKGFYLDPLFLYALERFEEPDLEADLAARFALPAGVAPRVRRTLLSGRFLVTT
jgi:hypothetical protein